MMPGVMGETVTPKLGSKALVTFVNGNPSKPICVAVHGGALEHVTSIESVALLLYNTLVSLFLATGPGPLTVSPALQALLGPAVLAGLAAGIVPAPPGTPSQIAAATAQLAGFLTGVAPANTSLYFAAPIVGLDTTKISNSSGMFPSIGMPSPEEF